MSTQNNSTIYTTVRKYTIHSAVRPSWAFADFMEAETLTRYLHLFNNRAARQQIADFVISLAASGELEDFTLGKFVYALSNCPDHVVQATLFYMDSRLTAAGRARLSDAVRREGVSYPETFFMEHADRLLEPEDFRAKNSPRHNAFIKRINFNRRNGTVSSVNGVFEIDGVQHVMRMFSSKPYTVSFRLVNSETDKIAAWGEIECNGNFREFYNSLDTFLRSFMRPYNPIVPCWKKVWYKTLDTDREINMKFGYIGG